MNIHTFYENGDPLSHLLDEGWRDYVGGAAAAASLAAAPLVPNAHAEPPNKPVVQNQAPTTGLQAEKDRIRNILKLKIEEETKVSEILNSSQLFQTNISYKQKYQRSQQLIRKYQKCLLDIDAISTMMALTDFIINKL